MDWEDNEKKTSNKLIMIIVAVIVAILLLLGGVIGLASFSKPKEVAPAPKPSVVAQQEETHETHHKQSLSRQSVKDKDHTKLSEGEKRETIAKYGKKGIELAEKNKVDIFQPVHGVYPARVPFPSDIKDSIGDDSAAIPGTMLRATTETWLAGSGIHTKGSPFVAPHSQEAQTLFTITQGFFGAKTWNYLARYTGGVDLPGQQTPKEEDAKCIIWAIYGGIDKDGTVPCADKKIKPGKGPWHMEIVAPSIAWNSDTDSVSDIDNGNSTTDQLGDISYTFVRMVFLPGPTPTTSYIASTPIAYMASQATDTGIVWSIDDMKIGQTKIQQVGGTPAELAKKHHNKK